MGISLQEIVNGRLSEPLSRMNILIRECMSTSNHLMNEVVENYLRTKGKQIRPIIVMLSAEMHGNINTNVLHAAASLEMLHNASLIHDDVVDETRERRGHATVNSLWGNHIAVLVGDFFVSKALEVGLRTENVSVIRGLSELGVELSVGEVDQICNARSHRFDEQDYLSMIGKKTASLFVYCMRIGASTAGVELAADADMLRYAELLGLCFQIRDDIFDYFPAGSIGKPTGNDLREGKVTLPLLYALRTTPSAESAAMRELLSDDHLLSDDEIQELISFARRHGGIEYSFSCMRSMQAEAHDIMSRHSDAGPAGEIFEQIFDFIIEREI